MEDKIEKASAELKEETSHLEITKEQLKRCDTEQKVKVREQEQEAHKNWMAAKQAERRLLELEEEMTVLKKRLMVVNTNHKSDGSSVLPIDIPTLPSLPGMPSPLPSLPGMPSTLPSLPNMPGTLPSLPGMPVDIPTLPGIASTPTPGLPGMFSLSTPSLL